MPIVINANGSTDVLPATSSIAPTIINAIATLRSTTSVALFMVRASAVLGRMTSVLQPERVSKKPCISPPGRCSRRATKPARSNISSYWRCV